MMRRREFLLPLGAVLPAIQRLAASPQLKVTSLELFVVKVSFRGNWVFVRLKTDKGITGLGEASHGLVGFGKAGARDDEVMGAELKEFFALVRGEPPFAIEKFRRRGWSRAKAGGRKAATAFSALEQALWDLCGKALGAPVYELLGGKVRDELKMYGNLNRATNEDRSPGGFAANARKVVADGFRAVKAAPFDGMARLSAPRAEVAKGIESAIRSIEAMRQAIGPEIDLLIDVHSHLDRALAIEVARRLEPQNLYWYEEPVRPENLDDTLAIARAIKQPLAAGEVLFGVEGFAPLVRNRAAAVIMPDVKHCGGILEGRHIAAMARAEGGIAVSPHNPSGPVATAASVQLCAGMSNLSILEHAWGEVPWRAELITPPEEIRNGTIRVPERPGLGIELNERAVRRHS